MAETKKGFNKSNSQFYHNNPLDYYTRLNDDRSTSYEKAALHTDRITYLAVIISGDVYGENKVRTIEDPVRGSTTYNSFEIRFMEDSTQGLEANNHPHLFYENPLDADTLEEFKKRKSLQNTRALSEQGNVIAEFILGTINPGTIVKIRREGELYFIIENSKKVHQSFVDFIARINEKGQSNKATDSFKNNAGQTYPPGAAYSDKSQSPLNNNQATYIKKANRVEENKIELIVLHSTDGSSKAGSAQATINRFSGNPTIAYTDPNTGKTNPPCSDYPEGPPHGTICHPTRNQIEKPVSTSIHYAIEGNGSVVQGVMDQDIAYHAGNYNPKSIGIELCGKPSVGPGEGSKGLYAKMYTDEMLDECAKLIAAKCALYNLKPTRKYITGHEDLDPGRRSDPGTKYGSNHWNWEDFLSRVKTFYDAEIAENGASSG